MCCSRCGQGQGRGFLAAPTAAGWLHSERSPSEVVGTSQTNPWNSTPPGASRGSRALPCHRSLHHPCKHLSPIRVQPTNVQPQCTSMVSWGSWCPAPWEPAHSKGPAVLQPSHATQEGLLDTLPLGLQPPADTELSPPLMRGHEHGFQQLLWVWHSLGRAGQAGMSISPWLSPAKAKFYIRSVLCFHSGCSSAGRPPCPSTFPSPHPAAPSSAPAPWIY